MLNGLKKLSLSPDGACIEMYGNRELTASGCKGVSDYAEDYINLDLGDFNMIIRGVSLVVQSFVFEQISVIGRIISVEFEG